MGTWILETNKYIYWMEGDYYIDSLQKVALPNGDYHAIIIPMKEWFSSENPPGSFKFSSVDTEPKRKPIDNNHGSGHVDAPDTKFVQAANYNSRNGTKIDMIVMHNTDGSLQAAVETFQDSSSQVSAHYIVARSGQIIQMVKDSFRAWHAGDRTVNSRSIGIEHEATSANRGMTPAQEQSSIALVKYLMEAYDIPIANIKPHREVSTMSGGTDCPRWIWSTDTDFENWKHAHFL